MPGFKLELRTALLLIIAVVSASPVSAARAHTATKELLLKAVAHEQ